MVALHSSAKLKRANLLRENLSAAELWNSNPTGAMLTYVISFKP